MAFMDFEWDDAKRRSTIEKHGIDFKDAKLIFDGRPVLYAPANQKGEDRWIAVGDLNGLVISVIYTFRGERHVSSLHAGPTKRNGSITISNSAGEKTRLESEGRTDWDRLRREDAAGLEPVRDDDEGEFDWSRAQVTMPRPKQAVSVRLDADVLDFFKADGKGYQTRINMVLRSYMTARQAK